MSNKKVVIRVDGNSKIGLGHIYRGIALAHMLKDEFIIEFVTKLDSTLSPIQETNFKFTILPLEITIDNEPNWLKEKYSSKNTILIIDGYQFNDKYQKNIKDNNFKLVYIDDLVSFHQHADIVINHSLGVKPDDYSAEPYTKFALGTEYALLRPTFLQAAKEDRTMSTIDTAFVCFGGTDIFDISYIATKALLEINQIKKINVVIGNAYTHNKIFNLTSHTDKINIFRNVSEEELLQILLKSSFAIIPSSTILFELCCIKMPILTGYYVENQKNILFSLLDKNAVISCGNISKMTKNSFKNKINQTLKKDFTNNMDAQKILFDGKSKERILKIMSLLKINDENKSIQ